MKNTVEYLTKHYDMGGDKFRYDITMKGSSVGAIDCDYMRLKTRGLLSNLWVSHLHQGQELESLLIGLAEGRCRNLGATELLTAEDTHHDLLLATGFVEETANPGWYMKSLVA